jgi:hypothetical protein
MITPTLLLTIAMIATLMFIMSLGVLIANKELQGSCGGLGSCACDEAELPRACDLVPGPGEPRCLPDPSKPCATHDSCPHARA